MVDVWRQRPDAQQLGKVSPPSQPVDNLWPLCASPCCAAEEWDRLSSSYRARGPHKLPVRASEHVRFHLLIIHVWEKKKKTMAGVREREREKEEGGGGKKKHETVWLQFFPPLLTRSLFLTQKATIRWQSLETRDVYKKRDLIIIITKERRCKSTKRGIKCSAGRARPFPPHCCRGMRPEKLLGRSSGRKAQPVRRGGVSAENRHFIRQHGDQLFFNPGPAHRAVHGGKQQTNRFVTQLLWLLSEPRRVITRVANSQINRPKSLFSDFSFFNVDVLSQSVLIVDKTRHLNASPWTLGNRHFFQA